MVRLKREEGSTLVLIVSMVAIVTLIALGAGHYTGAIINEGKSMRQLADAREAATMAATLMTQSNYCQTQLSQFSTPHLTKPTLSSQVITIGKLVDLNLFDLFSTAKTLNGYKLTDVKIDRITPLIHDHFYIGFLRFSMTSADPLVDRPFSNSFMIALQTQPNALGPLITKCTAIRSTDLAFIRASLKPTCESMKLIWNQTDQTCAFVPKLEQLSCPGGKILVGYDTEGKAKCA